MWSGETGVRKCSDRGRKLWTTQKGPLGMKYIPQHARKEAPRTDDTPTDDLLSYIGDQWVMIH